jgi:hypothetical protein
MIQSCFDKIFSDANTTKNIEKSKQQIRTAVASNKSKILDINSIYLDFLLDVFNIEKAKPPLDLNNGKAKTTSFASIKRNMSFIGNRSNNSVKIPTKKELKDQELM